MLFNLCILFYILQYLDYLLKVLLPEVLVLAYMKVHKTSYSQAEQNMHDACSIAGAIFT